MTSFSTENRFRGKVSLRQFKKTAERLEFRVKAVRSLYNLPGVKSEIFLTTDEKDYHEARGTRTFITEDKKIRNCITCERLNTLLEKREKYQLEDLDESLWTKSFKTELYITDNSPIHYLVWLGYEIMEPRKLFFCGHYLEKGSQKVLESFNKSNLFQKSGSGGFSKMIAQAYYSLNHLKKKALIEIK